MAHQPDKDAKTDEQTAETEQARKEREEREKAGVDQPVTQPPQPGVNPGRAQ